MYVHTQYIYVCVCVCVCKCVCVCVCIYIYICVVHFLVWIMKKERSFERNYFDLTPISEIKSGKRFWKSKHISFKFFPNLHQVIHSLSERYLITIFFTLSPQRTSTNLSALQSTNCTTYISQDNRIYDTVTLSLQDNSVNSEANVYFDMPPLLPSTRH
jgi:hypothetical protein